MKFKDKRKYECFYLTHDNIDEFKEWIEKNIIFDLIEFKVNGAYINKSYYDCVCVKIAIPLGMNGLHNESYNEYHCRFNRWYYTIDQINIYDLPDTGFKKFFELVDE